MTKSILKKSSEVVFSIYVYYSNLLIGWQLVSFVYLYHTTNSIEISNRLINWSVFQPYLIGIGAVITILLLIIQRISPIIHFQHISGLLKQVLVQNVFLALLFFNYLTIVLELHLEVFELISFIFAIWIIKRWGSVFFYSRVSSWHHPTTYGSFFVAALLNGFALLSLFHLEGMDSIYIQLILLILLAFDLLIVFARFQFLTNSGEVTNQIARNLMGSQILYFGSRIIIGIFMPAIFILYMIIVNRKDIQGVELLILVGTFLERYLFINSVEKKI